MEAVSAKPVSERLFESYLSSLGMSWEYEPELAGRGRITWSRMAMGSSCWRWKSSFAPTLCHRAAMRQRTLLVRH